MAEALKDINADKKRRLVSNVMIINIVYYCYIQSADATSPQSKIGASPKLPTVPDDHEIYQEVTEGLLI